MLYTPEHGTAGKEGDYATLSELNGEGLVDRQGHSMRGMVGAGVIGGYPKIEDWGKDNLYTQKDVNTKPKSAYPNSGRRGGGGGGGGGGGRTIHSTTPHINVPGAANVRPTRLNDARYDYLRPNYEVAGSAKARKQDTI